MQRVLHSCGREEEKAGAVAALRVTSAACGAADRERAQESGRRAGPAGGPAGNDPIRMVGNRPAARV